MSRVTFAVLTVLAVLALAACEQQEPSISLDEQVPADQREDDAPADDDGGEPDADADAGEPDADAGSAESVAFEAGDLFYEGLPETLPAGAITFEMDNVGNLPHDLTIEELGDRKVIDTEGGGSGSAVVELEPGEYTLYCSVPGHRSQMELTLTVEG